MSFFTMARYTTSVVDDVFDTPVLEIPASDSDEVFSKTVMVFLSACAAEDYIEASGWRGEQHLVELGPTQLLKWLKLAQESGVTQVAMNPHRHGQVDIPPDELFDLSDPLFVHAELLERLGTAISPLSRNE